MILTILTLMKCGYNIRRISQFFTITDIGASCSRLVVARARALFHREKWRRLRQQKNRKENKQRQIYTLPLNILYKRFL